MTIAIFCLLRRNRNPDAIAINPIVKQNQNAFGLNAWASIERKIPVQMTNNPNAMVT